MKECKYCGTIYADSQKICPNCGGSAIVTEAEKKAAELHQQREEQRRQEAFDGAKGNGVLKKIGIFAAIAAVLVIALIIVLPNLGGSGQGSSEDSLSNKESAAAYEQALTYIAAEDYTGAITELDRIDSSYKKYDDVLAAREEAVAGYKRQAFASVDQYATKGDYGNALSILTTMERIVGSDPDVAAKAVEINKADVLAKVEDCASKQDYAGAIQYINQKLNAVNNDSNILIKLSEMENAYRKVIKTQVVDAFKADGYEQAVSVINGALAVLPDDSELLELKNEYLSYTPVYLYDLDSDKSGYYVSSGSYAGVKAGDMEVSPSCELELCGNIVDTKGNDYTDAISGGDDWLYTEYHWNDYDLAGEYATFNGKFVLHSRVEDYPSSFSSPSLIVEADGVRLGEYELGYYDDPISFSFDVSGVQTLRIYIFAPKAHTGLSTYTGYLVDAYIQK